MKSRPTAWLASSCSRCSLRSPLALGCSGLLQNLGAKWVTRQIAEEFNLDEEQTAATRASVDRLLAAAPAALSSKVDMLVATVDAAIAKGLTEKKLIGMERQVDKIVDIVAGAIIDEASPILATLRDDQIDFAEARINERLDEAREELEDPKEERLEKATGQVRERGRGLGGRHQRRPRGVAPQVRRRVTRRGGRSGWADEARLERVGAVLRKASWRGGHSTRSGGNGRDRENWGPMPARPPPRVAPRDARRCSTSTRCSTPSRSTHASEHLHELHDKVKILPRRRRLMRRGRSVFSEQPA